MIHPGIRLSVALLVATACGSDPGQASSRGDSGVVTGGPGTTGTAGGSDDAGVPDASRAGPGDASPGEASSPTPPSEAGPPSTPTCHGMQAWQPGDSKTIAINFGTAGARSYDVYVGKNVKPGIAAPLVVNMHGLTNSPAIQAQFSQMNPVADDKGFVVVYPAGLNASFNAGSCCGLSSSGGVDDVGFVRAVVADAEANVCIDVKRVYETGFSNGGMMAYQLACNAADLFAAVAPTEGDNETNTPCMPSRPVPLAAFESLGDPVVLPANAQQSAQAWAAKDGCSDPSPTTTTISTFSCSEWSACSAGARVWYCTSPGGTHLPPAGSAPVIWSFLSQFALP